MQVLDTYIDLHLPCNLQRLAIKYHLPSLDEFVRVLAQLFQFLHKPLIFHEALCLVTLSQSVHHVSSTEWIIHFL